VAKDFDTMEVGNRSSNPDILSVSDPARRIWVTGGLGALLGSALARLFAGCAAPTRSGSLLGFKGIPTSTADAVIVPEGYVATAIAAWGEPVGIAGHMPAWRDDATNSAVDQAVQMGMHHDGMHFYPLAGSSTRGLLATNHEYTDDGLLHPGGMRPWTLEKVRKSQASHGVSVIEIELKADGWAMVRPSVYARRFTALTPFALGGPAAGHAMMKTAGDPAGRTVLGTFGNCASGETPWGTYLSGEENFVDYFNLGGAYSVPRRRHGSWTPKATSSACTKIWPDRWRPVPRYRPPQAYFAVGIANSAPLPMLAGQRCMIDFCLV
jgi:secreted PhoX family phosphatase